MTVMIGSGVEKLEGNCSGKVLKCGSIMRALGGRIANIRIMHRICGLGNLCYFVLK